MFKAPVLMTGGSRLQMKWVFLTEDLSPGCLFWGFQKLNSFREPLKWLSFHIEGETIELFCWSGSCCLVIYVILSPFKGQITETVSTISKIKGKLYCKDYPYRSPLPIEKGSLRQKESITHVLWWRLEDLEMSVLEMKKEWLPSHSSFPLLPSGFLK